MELKSKIELEDVLRKLRSLYNQKNIDGMSRFGINTHNSLGISMPILRNLSKKIKNDHQLALELWDTGIHEAKILAALIANPKLLDEDTIEKWVHDFDSWDVCDQTCLSAFKKHPLAFNKALEWCDADEEYVKRAGFALQAVLAVHAKKEPDEKFEEFFPMIIKYSTDNRNFVKKAVNWSLRQIGKRSSYLNLKSQEICNTILTLHHESTSARWIARDALKELAREQNKKNSKNNSD